MEEIMSVDEALNALKEGAILKDNGGSRFVFKRSKVSVYSTNSSYSLTAKDFLELYSNSKFIIDNTDDSEIDVEKDKEYYSFKHK